MFSSYTHPWYRKAKKRSRKDQTNLALNTGHEKQASVPDSQSSSAWPYHSTVPGESFLSLPYELRERIYQLYIHPAHPPQLPPLPADPSPLERVMTPLPSCGLFLASKQINSELSQILEREGCTYTIDIHLLPAQIFLTWTGLPGPARYVQSLEARIKKDYFSSTDTWYMFYERIRIPVQGLLRFLGDFLLHGPVLEHPSSKVGIAPYPRRPLDLFALDLIIPTVEAERGINVLEGLVEKIADIGLIRGAVNHMTFKCEQISDSQRTLEIQKGGGNLLQTARTWSDYGWTPGSDKCKCCWVYRRANLEAHRP